jgi:nickel superoxide dismutase
MNVKKIVLFTLLGFALNTSISFAHCEIPCGIYNDQMRINMIKEHITTIEKSMNQIMQLSKENPINYNQLVRWITNKEDHANQLQEIVTQYFMTQRIKLVDADDKAAVKEYEKQLTLLHHMLVHAMKCKQTTDLSHVKDLRKVVDDFAKAYFSEEDYEHLKGHH